MTLRSVLLDDEVILTIDGVLDGGLAPRYHQAVEQALEGKVRTLVVDLTRTTAVDGNGIAVLTATAATCRAHACQLIIATPGGAQAVIADPAQLRTLLARVARWREAS